MSVGLNDGGGKVINVIGYPASLKNLIGIALRRLLNAGGEDEKRLAFIRTFPTLAFYDQFKVDHEKPAGGQPTVMTSS